MGQELECTAHWAGKTAKGKALLETSEILFRGDFRVKIPLNAIQKLEAKNGELRLKTAEGLLMLELGDGAEKWREKIANSKSVVEKLGVKPGDKVALLGDLDPDFLKQLTNSKAQAVDGKIISNGKIAPDTSWIFLGIDEAAALAEVKHIAAKMKGSTALWIVYPKGQKAITENDVLAAGRKANLKDIKVVSFSPTHTALKFVVPATNR